MRRLSLDNNRHRDVVIVGAGIVGLATGYQLLGRQPRLRITVLEKEPTIAQHQTGHNSGVLHTGIYYRPGSLKATNCRLGKAELEKFCDQHGVPYEICGKVIVAVDTGELPILERIYERGQKNQVRCELIDTARLHELEPHADGIRAIHVPQAGIVDFVRVAQKLAELLTHHGTEIVTRAQVTDIRSYTDRVTVESTAGAWHARHVVNCAGLHSDRVCRMTGLRPQAKIVPFRGEYFRLTPQATGLCRNLIYPVPDSQFPFLGAHFTRMIGGGVECGPNAVLALAREGYRKTDVRLADLAESLTYPGFLRLALRHWRMGAEEMWRSLSKRAFVKALQRLVPAIEPAMLEPAPSGVRAQAVAQDGRLVDDFLIQSSQRIVNVCNAPSPAATSSLLIGRLIAERVLG